MTVIEGVFLDRTDQGLKPRFVTGEPPSDADMANVVQHISRRVIRKLRYLGYLEVGMAVPVATGYEPLRDSEPELARSVAALDQVQGRLSVTLRIACGERAGQKVRRIGSGFGYAGERPARTGPRCASVHGFPLHANTAMPAHRRDQLERLIHYTGRGAVSLERLTEDANGDLVCLFTRPWSDGTAGIKLSHLKLTSVPPPMVPARCRQELFAFDEARASVGSQETCAPWRLISSLCALKSHLKSSPPSFPKPVVPRPSTPGHP